MKTTKRIMTAIAAAGLSFASADVVILSENFEGMSDGDQLFSNLGTFESAGQTFPGPEVTLKASDYGVSGAPANSFGGGNRALYFNDSSTTLGGNLTLADDDTDSGTPIFDLAAAYNASLAHRVSFDYFYESPDGSSNPNMNMNLFMTDSAGALTGGLNLQLFSNIRQVKNNGTKLDDVAGSEFDQLKIDTWYRYELTIQPLDTATDTYDLLITEAGGTVVFDLSNLALGSDISDIARMELQGFASAASTHQAYFDNLSVTAIPEASTLSLLGIALLGLLVGRRFSKK